MKLTRKDLATLANHFAHVKKGYCCHQEADPGTLREIGYNAGIYGWNWTAYADTTTDTLYISCYRNVPGYIVER